MGCDIHAAVEALTNPFPNHPDVTWWMMAGEVVIDRDYTMLAALAGVRAEVVAERGEVIVPIAEPRGLPADRSDVMHAWWTYWEEDAHSTSWLSLEELAAHDGFDFSQLVSEMKARAAAYNALDTRLVFFFDN